MEVFADQLLRDGVAASNIHSVNLEDPDNDKYVDDWRLFYNDVSSRLIPDAMNYVFVDEIQQVNEFQKLVSGLRLKKNIDLYLTGSSSHLLSGELATLLSGRYVELPMLPLSFSEYVSGRVGVSAMDGKPEFSPTREELYRDYITNGSFPGTLQLGGNLPMIDTYLRGILSTVLFQDVASAQKVASTATLGRVVDFLASNVGNLTSVKRISDTLTTAGTKISRHTVESYLKGLTDAYVFYQARPLDLSGSRLLSSPDKYYLVDPALRRMLLGSARTDEGQILENVVYLELLRRNHEVHVGRINAKEVDFVANGNDATTYYQVSTTVRDDKTLQRELAPLQAIRDYNRRVLLTLDTAPPISHEGIQQLNVLEWLLEV
jgi:predicted AAA+ superfamily ATPase